VSAQAVQLSVTKLGGGSGAVTSVRAGIDCGTACTFDFNASEVVYLTATPVAENSFVGWGGACSGSFRICKLKPMARVPASCKVSGLRDSPSMESTAAERTLHPSIVMKS
jgi:hypothetical protein